MLEITLSIIAVLTSLGSLWFTDKQWQRIKKKVAMLSDAEAAIEVLPTWYTGRMMGDYWQFGLVTTNGYIIAISSIKAISDDGKWLDVELLTGDEVPERDGCTFITAVSDDRRSASVQISNIVTAYELVTS